jgi:hypothetical protein
MLVKPPGYVVSVTPAVEIDPTFQQAPFLSVKLFGRTAGMSGLLNRFFASFLQA